MGGQQRVTDTKGSPAGTSNVSKPPPKPVAVMSEIKQVEASEPLGLSQKANRVDASRIDHLFRKGINRRIYGTARPDK